MLTGTPRTVAAKDLARREISGSPSVSFHTRVTIRAMSITALFGVSR